MVPLRPPRRHARWVFRTLTTVFALLLCGCAWMPSPLNISVHTGKIGDDVPGDAVARTINVQITPVVRSVEPALRPGAASCPAHLDISEGKVGHCTLPVGGIAVPIAVTSGKEFATFFVRIDGVLLPMSKVERYLAAHILREYDVRATASCGDPRVRVIAVGSHIRCAIRGKGIPGQIEFKVTNAAGNVFIYRFPHMQLRDATLFGPYLTLHRAGRPTIMPGAVLAALIRRTAIDTEDPDAARMLRGLRVDCPARADLTGDRHVQCSVSVDAGTMPYEAWIDGTATFQVRAQRTLANTKRISLIAARYYENKLEAAQLPRRVSVDCGPDRVTFIDRDTKLMCRLDAGEGPRQLTISFPNFPSNSVLYHVEPRH
ncbi:MAG: hypothetical protein JWN27_4503 [Candidatus Eremiobacteraeota bacterium]|nr:hypothetical protein [Candidatus Eremiobacteraeota bacterium]